MNRSRHQPRRPVSFGLDADLHAWLQAYARQRGTSMVEVFHEAVAEYRARREAINIPVENILEGVCARCGEAMELTAEDLADPASAVCGECA